MLMAQSDLLMLIEARRRDVVSKQKQCVADKENGNCGSSSEEHEEQPLTAL
ncbi:hypothetical protein CLV76_1203 [Marivita geojedonensis]|nr:hypothetical protein CLV76_1203 [Marivita geojedonensis]